MRRFGSALLLLLCALALFSSPAAAKRARPPPNVVLVIGDDHAWPYSGFMGDPVIETPALDTLAAEGTVFSQAQLPASVCRPSLQALLSGLHPRQWQATREALSAQGPIPYREEVVHIRTLPRELGRQGYRSWEGGKMIEGTFEQAGFTQGMAKTRPLGLFYVEGDQFGRDGWDAARCGDTRTSDAPCPSLDPLRGFLDETGARPFFVWFAPMLPHLPFDPSAEFTERYLDRGLSPDEVTYYAQVTRLDALIGELLRELEARGLREDTLVIYVSDNGWEIGQGFFAALGHGKGSLHELGMRTPLIFHWPGRVPAGRVLDDLVSAEDVFSTILDYGGAEPVQGRSGRSLRPAIERGAPVALERYVTSSFIGLGDEYSGYVVRTSRWRYMAYADGREELFDMALDPFEEQDLAATRGDLLVEFREQLRLWQDEIETAPPRLEIVGRLVDASGSPHAGAAIAVFAGPVALEILSGPDGSFRFQNLPHGDYVIGPSPRESPPFDEVAVRIPVGPAGPELGEIVAPAAATPLRRAPGTLSGHVTTTRGAPLPDTTIRVRSLHPRDATQVVVRTDATGRYLAEHLPAGSYAIEADLPGGFRPAHAVAFVRSSEKRTRDLTLKRLPVLRPRAEASQHAIDRSTH